MSARHDNRNDHGCSDLNTLTETPSGFATGFAYEDLPDETVHLAKRFFIDTLGCAIGGYRSVPASPMRYEWPWEDSPPAATYSEAIGGEAFILSIRFVSLWSTPKAARLAD